MPREKEEAVMKKRLKYSIYIKSFDITVSVYEMENAIFYCRELAFQGYEFVMTVQYEESPYDDNNR